MGAHQHVLKQFKKNRNLMYLTLDQLLPASCCNSTTLSRTGPCMGSSEVEEQNYLLIYLRHFSIWKVRRKIRSHCLTRSGELSWGKPIRAWRKPSQSLQTPYPRRYPRFSAWDRTRLSGIMGWPFSIQHFERNTSQLWVACWAFCDCEASVLSFLRGKFTKKHSSESALGYLGSLQDT